MKNKQTVYILISAAIFLLIGAYLFVKFGPTKNQDQPVLVEVIDPIPSSFNQQAIDMLNDPTKTVDYEPAIELNNLGNTRPFGPLR